MYKRQAYGYRSHERIGDWRSNEVLHRVAAAQNPGSPYVHWTLGRVLLDRYRSTQDARYLAEALATYEAGQELAVQAKQGDETIFITADDYLQLNLGVAYCHLFKGEIEGFGDYETPKIVFEQTIQARPYSEEAYTGLGLSLLVGGEWADDEAERKRLWSEAEAAFKTALQLNGYYPMALFNLGRLYSLRAEWPRARHYFERVLEVRPRDLRARLELAQCYYEEGWSERAAEVAREGHALSPRSPDPPRLLGIFAAARGDARAALGWFDQALAVAPKDGPSLYQKALVLISMGEVDSAIIALRRACDLMPRQFDCHYNLGNLLERNGALGSALPYLKRAYEIGHPDETRMRDLRAGLMILGAGDPRFLYLMAALDNSRERQDVALVWVEAALAVDPEHGPSLYLKGNIEEKRGQLELAAESLREACAAMPNAFEPHSQLGMLLASLGAREEALDHLERARAIGVPEGLPAELRRLREEDIEEKIAELRGQQGPPAGG